MDDLSSRSGYNSLALGAVVVVLILCIERVHGAQSISPFTEEAAQRGLIYHVQPWQGPTQQFQGFGVAIADLNNNGHNDIVVMGRGDGRVGFFENDGSGFFTDRSFSGFTPKLVLPKGSGIAVADYNGDGLLDLYFTQQFYFSNELLRNEGNLNFTKVGIAAGVANEGHGECAAFGDYDLDGWLDLYVVNYTFWPGDLNNSDRHNKLYRNLGNGTFQDVSAAMGVDDPGMGFTAVWSDINRNCWVDLYLVNDRGHLAGQFPNQLWRNDDGILTNISQGSGADIGMWAMGIAAGDFVGNGYPDFYVTNLPQAGPGYDGLNPLLINQTDETFVDMCDEAEVCQFIFSWAAIFFDYNNNQWLDLYVVNQGGGGTYIPNRLYANHGVFPTSDVTQATGVGGSDAPAFNAAVGDVTGNGALDLLLNNYARANQPPANVQLFINHEGAKRNWIRFNVVGPPGSGNLYAIGSSIEVKTLNDGEEFVQWREIYSGGNNMKSQNELVFHFGLGQATLADEITVRWPGCEFERTLTNYSANKTWIIYPPQMLGDANGDKVINVFDLLGLLAAWGPLEPGSEIMDLTGSGVINVFDLLALLSKWGPIQ